jgi:hypothetical protein
MAQRGETAAEELNQPNSSRKVFASSARSDDVRSRGLVEKENQNV